MIRLNNICKKYKNNIVLSNVSYEFDKCFYYLQGKNGIGKSVLVKCMTGLEKVDKGEVEIEGNDILFLPEIDICDEWLTARENIELLYSLFGIKIDKIRREYIMDKLEIIDKDSLLNKLSKGTSVKLGISLIFEKNRFNTLIMDETLSHIDNKVRDIIFKALQDRVNEGSTVIIISHDKIEEDSIKKYDVKKIYMEKGGMIIDSI